jgi:hypothetical protein
MGSINAWSGACGNRVSADIGARQLLELSTL